MLLFLAQTSTAPAPPATTAAAVVEKVAATTQAAWAITAGDLGIAAVVFGVTALVLALLMIPFRGMLLRARLVTQYLTALVAISIFHAIMNLPGPNREPVLHSDNDVSYWATRLFAAVMVFVALRVIDRLAIVPVLTHRGTRKVPRFLHQMINIVLVVFAILIFGSVAFAWDIDKFLAGSAVVSIVLGLALQETLGNFFSGLVMQASPPFAIGDWIICGNYEGRVVDMTWRAVTIHTSDDNFILIPNGTVAKAEIVNYHAPTTATARDIKVGLDYDVPPCDALAVLRNAAIETPGVLSKPEPFVYLQDYTDAAVLYRVKFWINHPADHPKIEHAVRVNIWYRLHGRGFGIPFPTFNIEHISTREKKRTLAQAARGYRIEALNKVPLFSPLSPEQKQQLADSADDYVLAPGQTLFRQGDMEETFFIIRRGQVHVLVTPEGSTEERQVATLGPGDFFGEMSALTGQPRSATIRAVTPIGLVRIEKQDLHAIFAADPSIMEKISEIVARRNAEREAVMQGAGKTPAAEAVATQQKSILGRMMNFFGLGKAA